jgi:protein-tyrosine phosphatase
VLASHGYPTADLHRAHQVTSGELDERDLVLAMTSSHARALRRLASSPEAAERVVLYRSFDPAAPEVAPGGPEYLLDIDDPWYGGPREFEACLAQVEAAADGIVDHVRAALGAE